MQTKLKVKEQQPQNWDDDII